MALDLPLWKTTIGQKSISFLGLKVYSKTENGLKVVKTTATFRKSDNFGSYFFINYYLFHHYLFIYYSIIYFDYNNNIIINIVIYCLLLVLPLGGP